MDVFSLVRHLVSGKPRSPDRHVWKMPEVYSSAPHCRGSKTALQWRLQTQLPFDKKSNRILRCTPRRPQCVYQNGRNTQIMCQHHRTDKSKGNFVHKAILKSQLPKEAPHFWSYQTLRKSSSTLVYFGWVKEVRNGIQAANQGEQGVPSQARPGRSRRLTLQATVCPGRYSWFFQCYWSGLVALTASVYNT